MHHRQQQQQQSQQMTQQSQIQQSQTQQQRMSRTETRQFTTHQTVQEGHMQVSGQHMIDQAGLQQIGFGPNAAPPMFEKVFQNARFAQGGNATFDGRVTGKPQPTVVWTRKGAQMRDSSKYRISYNDQTGDITLAIYQIGPGDEGEYTCSARNQYGEAVCSVYIQPEGFPMAQQGTQKTQTFKTSEHKTTSTAHGTTYQKHQESSFYTNGTEQEFKIDTFEYRLLREVSFRESITRRHASETDVHVSTTVERSLGPPAPPQITQKPRNSKLLEGSDAVFSAKVAANPRPRLTWFRNGQRITQSNKYESSYSNNQATLRVKQAQSEDSGHYTLLAENPQGCIVSSAYLAIEPVTTQEGLVHDATFPVHQIEEPSETAKTLAPNFVRVCGDRDITEGKMTRFDCRVTGRPYPEVTWLINGRKVTDDHNHKILVNESGNHALMITSVGRNDSGIVTCVATNKSGETSFQCNLNVIEKEQVVAPKFVERFTTTSVKEGEPVVLHARAVGTPAPRITWQKDGVPLTPSHEIRITTDNSGSSTLDISRAKASDAAWYQCTAQNVAGSTATRARLFVEVPQGPMSEPWRLHLPRPTKVIEPEPEPGPEVIYLKHIEPAQPYYPRAEEDRVYPPPQFIIPLRDVMQLEGGKVHFEARIEPVGDPTMRVEWFVNGKSLEASSRATTIFRFGFIALDLLSITMRDSGEYVCRVTSATGSTESRATLGVTARASIERTSQHPDSLQYIQQLEDYSKYQRTDSLEETSSQKPHFIRPLQDQGALQEGRNAHFEAQLTPVSDPTMKVEWYKDGRPITASSRISTIFNFGYVSLNIMHLRAEDAGTYTVRAVNRMGEAISNANLQVIVRSTVTSDLGIPEQQRYIEKVGELEAYQQQQHHKYVQETPESSQPPEFKTPIKDQHGIREGGFAHFEARLEPTGDSTLKVEWLKDGRPVEASSRMTTFFNFGYVALTIKAVTIHDVGNYTCRAYNALGEAATTAQLSVVSKKDIIVDSQHPGGLQKIQHLEDSTRYTRKMDEEVTVTQKPRFLGPLKGTNKIVEGQRAHFEARVEPQNDSTMKLDWYFNGKLIESANRIQTYHDFGYVALDILSVRGEDSGTYTVVARNALGEAQLSASMVVETRASIDTRSMHRTAYEKTQRMERPPHVEPEYQIEELCKSKPIFVVPLSDPQPLSEGRNIHLECRLEPMGDPTMRVDWFCNGKPITVGSRFRTYYDFGFVALDIIHATALDSGEYTVRATNQLGSAHTSVRYNKKKRGAYKEAIRQATLEAREIVENRIRKETPLVSSPSQNIITVPPPALASPREIDVMS
ncbi:titin-like [Photinus pyralis]|uniref:titin-like n=1 Tax=Photinus pyralis TaxID=7054 RepID=UPI0012674332|nr:titin-like [Photinus pyralis]